MENIHSRRQRRLALFTAFFLALFAHLLLLLIPFSRDVAHPVEAKMSVSIQLRDKIIRPLIEEKPPEPAVDPEPALDHVSIPVTPTRPPLREEQAAPAVEPAEPPPELAKHILSSQFDYRAPASRVVFSETGEGPAPADFRLPIRPSLDEVLNPVPEQLPFADEPRLALVAYHPGVLGSVQRFRDSLMFKKVWTTKNGTKIACGWFLIIAGCSWD
jgi:hypothetical protein